MWEDEGGDSYRHRSAVSVGPISDHERFFRPELHRLAHPEKRLGFRLDPTMLERMAPEIDIAGQIVVLEDRFQVIVNVATDASAIAARLNLFQDIRNILVRKARRETAVLFIDSSGQRRIEACL